MNGAGGELGDGGVNKRPRKWKQTVIEETGEEEEDETDGAIMGLVMLDGEGEGDGE